MKKIREYKEAKISKNITSPPPRHHHCLKGILLELSAAARTLTHVGVVCSEMSAHGYLRECSVFLGEADLIIFMRFHLGNKTKYRVL